MDINGDYDHSKTVPVRIGDGVSVFNVYPNPVHDEATLVIRSEEYTTGLVEIFDAAGKRIYSDIVEVQQGENGFIIDLNSFDAGVYSVRFGEKVIRLMKY